MACVTEVYGYAAPRSNGIRLPFGFRGFTRVAIFAATGLVAGSWMMTALGTLETVVPAFAPVAPIMRRVSLIAPQTLAVVDHKIAPSRRIRQSFIDAYTADTVYSNLDWHRTKNTNDKPIIADIGPDSVIEDKPVDTASLIELRADRVHRVEPVVASVLPEQPAAEAGATVVAYAQIPNASQAASAFSKIEPLSQTEEADAVEKQTNLPTGNVVPVPQPAPDQKTDMAAEDEATQDAFLPDDVPLPGAKPSLRRSRMHGKTELAYAPESGATEEPRPGLFSPLFNQAARSKVAIYDISAATVYLPSGERLEAHSGLGSMRDNPRYVNQKNRGPTPPHTYDLRMREALFHGVEAIRLTPVDGNNRYNRDGLLAHTFMLGRRGDSNGCVVFKDYPRFLRAFKRGEFNKMVVVTRIPSSKPARIASLF
ncbi:DUF2778 domain-containing protein [Ochrobactrum oryzae]|uniref:Tlde1 domain-containing protein n=1 Tax=Brucella oryzae TaxID=335286 RepID=A0A2S7J4L1_9HYPH|nr:tlde1 domain-containing protein [Brucella oryzae]NKC21944.1 DUF2778 domain-containing protein [Brucella oryzae]PQA75184.1 hypothetical protein C3731_02935 [Brucella oryzae]